MSFVSSIRNAAIVTVLATLQVQAATISGQITADNYFQVSYGTGGNHTVVYQDSDGNQWNQLNSIRFEIPDDVLADCGCRIAITAWGDGSVAEGLYGHLQWNSNQVHTGNPAFTVANAGQTGPLNGPQLASFANSGGPTTVNTYNWPGMPNGQTQWVWDGGRGGGGDRNARVFSVKCSDVVRRNTGGRPIPGTAQPMRIQQRAPVRLLQPTWK